jgi:hypothetical protein
MLRDIEYVESMILRTCNLACDGCSTFSDLKWSEWIPWQQGKQEIQPWLERVRPESWGIMGGEPLLHPELAQWLQGIRQLMPHTRIRFTTNAVLLHQHWHIAELLHELGNCTLRFSYHTPGAELDSVIQRVFDTWPLWPVKEYGVKRWAGHNGFRFQISRPREFLRSYQGTMPNIAPHDNEATQAFANCVQQRCPMLWQGQLYKCSTAALTPDLLSRYGWPNLEQWQPYIGTGLDVTCSDQALDEFLLNYGKANRICRQCPTAQDSHSTIDHLSTVRYKSQRLQLRKTS